MTSMFLKRTALFLSLLPVSLGPAALILTPVTLRAQTLTSGDIAGTVTDASGAAIPGATVKAVNTGTGAVKEVTTGGAGDYRISLLQPGSYTVTATANGFQTTQANLAVTVGQPTPQNFKLAVAQSSQTVEVMGTTAPLLQTDTSDMSTTINQQQIQNLPNPGGDITYPVQTTQGVVMNTQGGYGNFEAFGLPGTSNNYTVNGAEDNDPFLNLNNSGPSNLLLGSNDVDQVNVVANAYGAQYGSLGGIQENILTRSGTNAFHGNANYYWTNSDINANQWFNDNTATPEAFSNANQGGAAIGGPIMKNKVFFFVNYEIMHFVTTIPTQVVLPNATYESAVIANLQSTGQAGQVPFYNQLFTAYNNAPGASRAVPYNGTTYANDFFGTAKNYLPEQLVTARVDTKFGPNDSFFAHFKWDHGIQPTYVDPISSAFNATSNQPDYEGQMEETHTFSPNLVNQFNFSTAWYSAIFVNSNPTAAMAITPYALTWSDSSFTTLGGETNFFPEGRNVTQYQFNDDVSWTKGKHTLKFGATFKRDDTTDADPQSGSQFADAAELGPAANGPLAPITNPAVSGDDFGYGQMVAATQVFPTRPTAPIAQYNLGLYVQDQWKMASNFQVTAGVRVEHNSNPVCQIDCFGRFNTNWYSVTAGLATPYNSVIASGLHQTFIGLQTVAVDPRIGFTFSPPNHPNTVVRGGFGMFTDIFPATVADDLLTNPPFSAAFTASGLVSPAVAGSVTSVLTNSNQAFVNGYASGGSYNSISAADPFFAQPSFTTVASSIQYPTYEEYSLQIQQQFGRFTSMQIGYVGNHGYHEPWVNTGVNVYEATATGAPAFGGVGATAPLPAFGSITNIQSSATSNYNGLLASVKHQSRYVTLQFNYTFSHALDEISNGGFLYFGADSAGNVNPTTIDPYNLALQNYGNADYDIRHSLNGNYLINLPYYGGPHILTGNWIISGTLFWHSGFPFSAIDGDATADLAPNYGSGDLAGVVLADVINPAVPHHCGINKASPSTSCFGANPSEYFAESTGFGGQRRNQFTGPGYFNTDVSLMKGFKIPRLESGLFQVGGTAYNILNHPNFLNPNTNFSDTAGFGTVTATASAPTSVYGSFLGGNASARIVQLKATIRF